MELLFIGMAEIFLVVMVSMATAAPLIFVVIALVDLFKRDFGYKSTDKILLVGFIILAPILGSIIYYLILRKNYPLKRSLVYQDTFKREI